MKKSSLPTPITILVLTLLTALVWAGLSIFRAVTLKPNTTVAEDIIKPLDPKLNTEVIQKIESAIYFEDSDIPAINNIESVPTVTAPTPAATILPTAEPEASQSAAEE